MAQPILELSSLQPTRPFIRLDGVAYDLRVSGDFGIRELARYNYLTREAEALQSEASDTISDDQAERLTRLLSEAVAIVWMAPPEIRDKLTDEQRLSVIAAFARTVSRAATPAKRKSRSTSANSRRASARATASVTG